MQKKRVSSSITIHQLVSAVLFLSHWSSEQNHNHGGVQRRQSRRSRQPRPVKSISLAFFSLVLSLSSFPVKAAF